MAGGPERPACGLPAAQSAFICKDSRLPGPVTGGLKKLSHMSLVNQCVALLENLPE